jgi:hypothetical protein
MCELCAILSLLGKARCDGIPVQAQGLGRLIVSDVIISFVGNVLGLDEGSFCRDNLGIVPRSTTSSCTIC